MAANASNKKKDDRSKSKNKRQQNAIVRFWRSTRGELKKVSWPTRPETWRLTKIVIYVTLAMAAFLGLLDYVFSQLVALLV